MKKSYEIATINIDKDGKYCIQWKESNSGKLEDDHLYSDELKSVLSYTLERLEANKTAYIHNIFKVESDMVADNTPEQYHPLEGDTKKDVKLLPYLTKRLLYKMKRLFCRCK